jgi:hypothetical protein
MAKVNSLYMEQELEVEDAAYDILREAKFISCAPSEILAHNAEWLEEAREFLNDALAKASRVREAA